MFTVSLLRSMEVSKVGLMVYFSSMFASLMMIGSTALIGALSLMKTHSILMDCAVRSRDTSHSRMRRVVGYGLHGRSIGGCWV